MIIVFFNLTGMDRLCASTDEGKLHFFVIGPRSLHFLDGEFMMGDCSPSKSSAGLGITHSYF